MRIALVLLVLATACSKKQDKAPPAGSAGSAGSGSAAPAGDGGIATPGARPPEPPPTCDAMLPQAIRDKHFKGATITAAPPSHGGEKCQIKLGDQLPTLIEAACGPAIAPMKEDVIKSFRNTYERGRPLPGVGNPALASAMDNGQTVVYAWTADSTCMIAGELPKGVDAAAVLTDWLARLPPK